MKGRFIGVGVGPGDPDLITMKGWQTIQSAPVVSYIANDKGHSQARSIAGNALSSRTVAAVEIPVVMPMCNDRSVANRIYDEAMTEIITQLENGRDVVFLCEGDPLFFGSFSYLLMRIKPSMSLECEVIPGITSVQAATACLLQPLTMLKDSFVVISGRHSESFLREALETHNSVAIMKAGQARPKILAALRASHRLRDACYLENIGRENEYRCEDCRQLADSKGPYFSLFLVTRKEEALAS